MKEKELKKLNEEELTNTNNVEKKKKRSISAREKNGKRQDQRSQLRRK